MVTLVLDIADFKRGSLRRKWHSNFSVGVAITPKNAGLVTLGGCIIYPRKETPMMPVQTPAGLCDGITDAAETSTTFLHLAEQQSCKGLRTLREARSWSQADAVRAMMACSTTEERRSLPPADTLLRSWKRWESGKVEPDGGRAEPFYRPIIARIFGTTPEKIFSPRGETRTPYAVGIADLRDELSSRRDQIRQIIRKLEGELAYLDAVLAVPVPASSR